MDPQVRNFLDQMKAANAPGWETMEPQSARDLFSSMGEMFPPKEDVASVEDITSHSGIALRLYRSSSASASAAPVVMFFHGGGWLLGNIETHDTTCRRLANVSGAIIVSVDYRVAPENRYPTALNDCFEATQLIASRASEYGIDPRRLAVAGDSAGGNLAAAVCLMARDENGPEISDQVLIYPVTDCGCETQSYRDFSTGYGLTEAAMRWFWQHYLGEADGRHPYASPLAATDLSNLPPALVATAEYDVLRDEGEAYAKGLKEAGVEVELRRYEGVIHGFFHFAGLFDRGKQALDEVGVAIKERV